MADLNTIVTLSDGRRIELGTLLHEHALLMKFVQNIARGATADAKAGQPSRPGPYINRRKFQRLSHEEAVDLLRELQVPPYAQISTDG